MATTIDPELATKSVTSISAPPAAEIPVARWQTQLKKSIRDPRILCEYLHLPDACLPAAIAASRLFPLFAPLPYVNRIEPGNPDDPLLRQLLPLDEELASPPPFVVDPVGDTEAWMAPGLLKKYQGRALLIATGACAIHCRYCFRRHYPYSEQPHSLEQWEPALQAIRNDASLEEIILSGGDPLTLVDHQLEALIKQLDQVPHLRRLRIHTRLPIMIPERVNESMLSWLTSTRLAPVFVLHCNHPAEIDHQVSRSLAQLSTAGIPLLNQAVLLRGVNDDATTLAELMTMLVEHRVMPYYLHQLDRVQGAHHFEVPLEQGQALMQALHARLPGYAVPRYVQEQPGAAGKTELPWSAASTTSLDQANEIP